MIQDDIKSVRRSSFDSLHSHEPVAMPSPTSTRPSWLLSVAIIFIVAFDSSLNSFLCLDAFVKVWEAYIPFKAKHAYIFFFKQ